MRNRKTSLLFLVLLVALLAAACGSSTSTKTTYTTVDVKTAYDQINSTANAVVVDVREPSEWAATGTVPGAKLISLGNVEKQAASELSKDDTIFVICNSGNRSRQASDTLVKQGYKHVINIDGGIQAWMSANLPTAPYTRVSLTPSKRKHGDLNAIAVLFS